jgi:hypothetical protein
MGKRSGESLTGPAGRIKIMVFDGWFTLRVIRLRRLRSGSMGEAFWVQLRRRKGLQDIQAAPVAGAYRA